MERRRPREARDPPLAGRPLQRYRYADVRGWRAHRSGGAHCHQRIKGMAPSVPAAAYQQEGQERLGHSTIALTMDTHLFPLSDDVDELAAAKHALLG